MTTSVWITLEHVECGVKGCGVIFGLSPAMHKRMQEEGRHVWCPNGHEIWYHSTEVQNLKDQLAREKHKAEQAQARADSNWRYAESIERSLRVTKGHHTRLKKRVACGVCPCCKRTFQNLRRHMKGQHPKYVEEK